jgi:large subunit ribosomal protein L10
MPNERKIRIVNELQQKLQNAKGVVLASYDGLNVPELQDLRARLREAKAELKIVKNTLLKLTLRESPFKFNDDNDLKGPTAVVISREDEIAPVKALYDFAAEHEALKVKGGFFGGKWTAAEVLAQIAKLPAKDELRSSIVRILQWPAFRLVNVLQANQRKLLVALSEIAKQKEQ